jgi:hypothetical protein
MKNVMDYNRLRLQITPCLQLSLQYQYNLHLDIFLCKCSDIKGLDIAPIPIYYQDAIHAWNNFWGHVLRNLKMTF